MRISFLLSFLFLSFCVNRSEYKSTIKNDVQDNFFSKTDDKSLINNEKIKEKWWHEFNDKILNDLIEEAEKSNRNVEIARQNLIKSRYAVTFATMGIFPTVGVGYNYYMFKNPLFGPGIDLKLFQAGFDAQWELDIWGKTLDRRSAANFRSLKMMQNHSNVLLSLYAEICKNYIELRKLQNLQKNCESRLLIYKKISDFKEKGFEIGIIKKDELLQSKLQIENETINLRDFDTKIKTLIFQISVLTGNLPEALEERLKKEEINIKDYKTEVVPIGMRSDLLTRRPDIKMAEYELEALIDDSSVNLKQMLPSLQISGSSMFGAKNATGVFTGANIVNLNVGPRFPILQLGSLFTQYKMSKIDAKVAMLEYEQIILNALRDTEIALTTYLNNLGSEYNSKRYFEIGSELYRYKKKMHDIGNINMGELLNSEIDFLLVDDLLIKAKERTITSLIALHKELGGGFDREIEIDGGEVKYVERKEEDLKNYQDNIEKLNKNENKLEHE